MKFLFSLGLLAFVFSFCNLSEKISKLKGEGTNDQKTTTNSSTDSKNSSSDTRVEKPELTSAQEAVINSGSPVLWQQQGITFTVPKGWKKMDVKKESFNYGSPDLGFLIGTISVMPDNFPSETSLNATYESSLQQLKNGKYENARFLEIDGIKGVEFVEAMPEEKDSPRRHQWIAFRNYQGQNQQLNIMVSTKGSNFDKHKDDFSAILYSMKIDK
ncbi:hypothetical protein BH20ACI4_BH20ACI4_09160 [soil metagenome]